ncbi:MAG: hypothetical protein ACRD0M_04025 [Acidimicrobiales bacterium]
MTTRVAAYVPDLMDRSRIAAAQPETTFVARPTDLVGADADVVVVDLGRPGVMEVLPQLSVPAIGFASHVARDLIEAAIAAGCDRVLARSAFFSRLPELLVARPD